METIRIAICDDEPNMRNLLAGLVRRQDPACEITQYEDSLAYLRDEREHDLLFLDIELGSSETPDAMNGMELAGKLRGLPLRRQPVIVFVTGYDRYVYQAFDVEAFHYLLKPVDEARFAEVFSKAAEKIASLNRQRAAPLVIEFAGSNRVVALQDIYYIESRGHKLLLHLKDGSLEYYGKMSELEAKLEGLFARIHRGYLVNLSYVEEYTRSEAILRNGVRLIISKRKYDAFVKAHLRFLQE